MGTKIDDIENEINTCERCILHESRTNYVPGSGNPDADILFVGEAPGKNEDIQGKPFVGRSGKLLDELLKSIGISREDIFITNTVKCRPPDNRDPLPAEKRECSGYLRMQIEAIKPKIIVSLGRHAMKYFFDFFSIGKSPISVCHGKKYQIDNTIFSGFFIPLFHPAVAIYNRNRKGELLDDFRSIKGLL